MAIINAGETVQVNVTIENIGQQLGTFQMQAVVVPVGDVFTNPVNTFYETTSLINNTVQSVISPNEQSTLIMYSQPWAGGDPLAYGSLEEFDVIFRITVAETSEVYDFRGAEKLTHQELAAAQPTIIDVVYTIAA